MRWVSKILSCFSITIACFYAFPCYSQIINGDFSPGLDGWETNGNVSVEEGAAILRTGGINGKWDTSLSTSFNVAGDRLTFRYFFDVTGYDDIIYGDYPSFPLDSFQVSVDAGGEDYLVESLAWVPAGYFIPFSMDISSITPGTSAILSFILLDEDDGFYAVAAIDDVSDPYDTVPEPGTLILLGSELIGLFICSRYRCVLKASLFIAILCVCIISSSGIAHGKLVEQNVDDMTSLEFTSPLFNTRTNTLTLNMAATNISDKSIFTPLKVIITGISAPDVTVANPDGYTPEGLPYFDLSSYIADKELSPGEKTSSVKIAFYNPKRVKFRWDQDVIAFIDVYTGLGPVIENICLIPGESSPVCEFYYKDFGTEDPEFDRLLERPLPEMYMYERVRVYAYDYEEHPIRVTINGIEAAYYEEGFYYYGDFVLQDGLNTISIVVTNDAGISAGRDIVLNIDTIPPLINILQPSNGEIVTSSGQVINGTVDDIEINKVMLIKDFIYWEEFPVLNGSFSANVNLSPGHNNITIEASDLAGNSTRSNMDILYVYSETGDITGRISSSVLGLPVAGTVITAISGNNGDQRTVISGEDGRYTIEGISSGDITLLVEKEGYASGRLTIFSLGGAAPTVRDISLVPVNTRDTFTLTGQVKNTAGLPLQGSKISIAGAALTSASDRNGIYLISGIPRNSFIAEASRYGYEAVSLNVNAGVYSSNTTILVHDFILKEIPCAIGIISPADGEYVPGDGLLVTGFVRCGEREVGVRVNGILAQVYKGYFVANDVPLSEDVNRITAEMIDQSGTIVTASIAVALQQGDTAEPLIHAQEAGIVPVELSVDIEVPPGISFTEYSLQISGPAAAGSISKDPLHYNISINEPGIYILTFSAADSDGNRYTRKFGFTGVARADAEGMLSLLWTKLKDSIAAGNMEDALSLFTPETRHRYAQQLLLLGDRLPEVFSTIGDIQLITLKDNIAKARVYEGDITHYVWFARDIYGLWKIHKF